MDTAGGGPDPHGDRRICVALWVELHTEKLVAWCAGRNFAYLRQAATKCTEDGERLWVRVEVRLDYRLGKDDITAEEIGAAVGRLM